MTRRPAAFPIAVLLFLPLVSSALGQEIRNVTVGWGDALRLGRWTPVFITVEDAAAREVDLQIHGTYGEKSEAMWLHQTAVAQPSPTTYCLLFPINAQLSRVDVIVSDRQTGKTLGTRALQNSAAFSPAGRMPMKILATDDLFVGISGNVDDALRLQAQLKRAGVIAGVLDPIRLPGNFSGFDGVSVLILAAPEFEQIKPDAQGAILEWVRRGGNLLLIPPTTALPTNDPLVESLPCTIGENRTSTSATTRLNARALSPRPGSTALQILGETGYVRWLGLGRIAVVPVDVSPLAFSDDRAANFFWRTLLSPLAKVPAMKEPTAVSVSEADETLASGPNAAQSVGRGPRESDAILHVLETMGATGSARRIDWGGALIGIAAICFLLGPVDSVILMRFGQRPRNWITLSSWVGLILSVGLVVAARSMESSPAISTFRLVDQVDDSVVAATDIIAVSSDRPMKVPLDLDKSEWWEPANQAARSFAADRFVDGQCHEDKTGCRPEFAKLNGSEAQAWHGESAIAGPALLRANLRLQQGADGKDHLVGNLTNLAATAMADIHILTASGNFAIGQPLAAGTTIDVDQVAMSGPISLAALPSDVMDISPERADRIDELIKSGWACVLGQMPDSGDLKVGSHVESHWQVLRAIFPLSK